MSLYDFKKGFVELVNSIDPLVDRKEYADGLKSLYKSTGVGEVGYDYITGDQVNVDISNGYIEEDAPQSGE